MKNGRDPHWDDPKITSLSAARKKAEAARKAVGGEGPKRSVKEWLVGAVIVAMAVGFLVQMTKPLWQGALSFAR